MSLPPAAVSDGAFSSGLAAPTLATAFIATLVERRGRVSLAGLALEVGSQPSDRLYLPLTPSPATTASILSR